MIRIETYNLLPAFATNTYLVFDDASTQAMIIDPAAPSGQLLNRIKDLKVTYIVNTHGHGDHIGGNVWFRDKTQAKVAIHKADADMLTDARKNLSAYMEMPLEHRKADLLLEDGDYIELGSFKFRVIHTPGHTKGGICLLCDKFLISGDTLFEQSIGRTDLPGGDFEQLNASIRDKLFILDDDVVVFPGHGPQTTIGIEKKINPFIKWELR